LLGKDKPTVIGEIVEQLDRDGNEDGNGDCQYGKGHQFSYENIH